MSFVTGRVYLTGVLNYQEAQFYSVNITVFDGTYGDWKMLRFNLFDVAHAPSFSNLPANTNVDEDTPSCELLFKVISEDRDFDDISYKLINAAPFMIDNQSKFYVT